MNDREHGRFQRVPPTEYDRARADRQPSRPAAEFEYQELVESLEGIVWRCDAQTFRFTFVSRQAEALLGYPVERWLNEPGFWENSIHPEDRDQAVSFCVKATREKQSHKFDYRMIAADGRIVWIRDIVRVVVENGEPTDLIGLMIDITESRRLEEDLRASDQRFRDLFHSVQVGVVVAGPKAQVLMCNPAALALLGLPEEHADHLVGKTACDLKWSCVHEDGSPCPADECPVPQAIATRQPVRNVVLGVYRPLLRDRVWLLVNAQPRLSADGIVTRVYCSFEDITERRDAVEDLRKQKEVLQKIFDHVPVMMSFTGEDGRLKMVNREWERIIGWSFEEIEQQHVDVFASAYPDPQDRQAVRDFIAAASGTWADFKTRTRDGRTVVTTWAKVKLSDGTTIGIGQDITKRKRAEEFLRHSEDRLRQIIDTIPTMAWTSRPDGVVDFLNQRWMDYTGLSVDAEQDPSCIVHPEDLPAVMDKWGPLLADGKPFEGEMRLQRADGEYRWFLVRNVPLRDDLGNIVKWFGTSTEIQDRRQAEDALRSSVDELRALAAHLQSVREEERTRVAREIHDELGQVLTGIKLESASLIRELPRAARHQSNRAASIVKLADETIQAVRRIATELRPGILDDLGLVAAVEWAAEEFENRTGTKCQVDLLQDDIVIDRERATALFRILQETLTNVARHAHATHVNVRLTREDGSLIFEIHDNGTGISEEELAAGRSLGILGMRERAVLLGGELAISGAPGAGTTVNVRIPEPVGPSRSQVSDRRKNPSGLLAPGP